MPTTLQQRSGGGASSMDATLMPPLSSAPPGAPAGDEGVTLSSSRRASRSAAQASRDERRCDQTSFSHRPNVSDHGVEAQEKRKQTIRKKVGRALQRESPAAGHLAHM